MHTYAYMGARGERKIQTILEFCINFSKNEKKLQKLAKNALQKILKAVLYAGCHETSAKI